MTPADRRVARGQARSAILAAAVALVRRQGLAATSVDEVCATAGVTKGAFFHHFPSKEALAVAAVDHWSATTGELFAAAAYHELPSASRRVLGYLDLRAALADGAPTGLSCLAGTMAQEAFATSDPIRRACEASILGHAATLEADIAEALRLAGRADDIDAASLARYTQTVIQGAFVLAKATGDAQVVREGIGHLRHYARASSTRHRDEKCRQGRVFGGASGGYLSRDGGDEAAGSTHAKGAPVSDAENVREQAESIIQDENETPTVLDKVDKMGEGDTAEQVSELKKASDERIVGN